MITITALIITAAVIALIVILLHFSATVFFSFGSGGIRYRIRYFGFTVYPREKKSGRKKAGKKSGSAKKKKPPDVKDDICEEFQDDLESDVAKSGLSDGEPERTLPEDADNIKKIAAENKETSKTKRPEKHRRKKSVPSEPKPAGKLKRIKSAYGRYKPYIPMSWKYFRKLLKAVRISADDVVIKVGREDAHEAAIYYGIIQSAAAAALSFLSEVFTVRVKKFDVDPDFTRNCFSAKGELTARVRPSALIAAAVCFAVNFLIIKIRIKIKTGRTEKKTGAVRSGASAV